MYYVKWIKLGYGNGLLPVRYEAIFQTNAAYTSIGPPEDLMELQTFCIEKMQ